MKCAGLLGLVLSLSLPSLGLAAGQDVSPDLRQRAIANCSEDAMRLCPQAMTDETAAVACMASKRPSLTPSCRVVYDQVARALKD